MLDKEDALFDLSICNVSAKTCWIHLHSKYVLPFETSHFDPLLLGKFVNMRLAVEQEM